MLIQDETENFRLCWKSNSAELSCGMWPDSASGDLWSCDLLNYVLCFAFMTCVSNHLLSVLRARSFHPRKLFIPAHLPSRAAMTFAQKGCRVKSDWSSESQTAWIAGSMRYRLPTAILSISSKFIPLTSSHLFISYTLQSLLSIPKALRLTHHSMSVCL